MVLMPQAAELNNGDAQYVQSGSLICTSVPSPGILSSERFPWCAYTIAFTSRNPSPVPLCWATWRASNLHERLKTPEKSSGAMPIPCR